MDKEKVEEYLETQLWKDIFDINSMLGFELVGKYNGPFTCTDKKMSEIKYTLQQFRQLNVSNTKLKNSRTNVDYSVRDLPVTKEQRSLTLQENSAVGTHQM